MKSLYVVVLLDIQMKFFYSGSLIKVVLVSVETIMRVEIDYSNGY